jgi:hypothetical protein
VIIEFAPQHAYPGAVTPGMQASGRWVTKKILKMKKGR